MGFKIQSLNIMPVGFYISFRIDTRNYNKKILKGNLLVIKKIIIAISGPIINLLFTVCFFIIEKNEIFNIKTETLIYANLLVLIFNIIPIYPLDGGRIIKNIVYLFSGKINSLKVTNIISNVVAVLLTIFSISISIWFYNIAYMFAIIYIWIMVIKENKICKIKIKMYKILKNNIAINKD